MTGGRAILVDRLAYAYPDGTSALEEVTFAADPGSALALVGANGAGKSTLLLHLNACLLPASGSVRIGGQPVTRETATQVRREVGLVFQDADDQLFMPTVLEDVAFAPRQNGRSPEEAATVARSALERVGMLHLQHRPPYRLSAGEKRAVAIATVLAQSPSVLALDEPSANLDPRTRRRLIDLLRALPHTRVIATHDLELALAVCGQTVVLDQGRVVAQGPTRDVLSNETLMLAHGLERPASLAMESAPSPFPESTG